MADKTLELVATGIKARFRSIVLLPVEWAVAAIPAIIILYFVAMAVSVALGPVLGPLPHWLSPRSTLSGSLVNPLVANH